MLTKRLGRSDLMVPPVVFGSNVFGWTVDAQKSFRLLDGLIDRGLNMIDTADVYSNWVEGHEGGESEALIGDWLSMRGGRARVIVATKGGMRMGEGREGLSARWLTQAVDDSLRRLKTDYIDLYQLHQPDDKTPTEETVQVMARLIDAGKIRFFGVSNFSTAQISDLLRVSHDLGLPRPESVQPEFNLIARNEFEGTLAELCQREKLGAISYFALAAGFLSGKYRSQADLKGARSARVASFMNERNLRILQKLIAVAEAEGISPAAAAIAWIRTQPAITAPIASATSMAQLDEIVLAARHELDPQSLSVLNHSDAP